MVRSGLRAGELKAGAMSDQALSIEFPNGARFEVSALDVAKHGHRIHEIIRVLSELHGVPRLVGLLPAAEAVETVYAPVSLTNLHPPLSPWLRRIA